MTFGVTDAGFVLKRLADIRSELQVGFRGIYGEELDLSPGSEPSQVIDTFAGQLSETWEGLLGVYNAFDTTNSEGVGLENVAALFGARKEEATPTKGVAEFRGAPNTIIPLRTEIRSTARNLNFETTDPATIPQSGVVLVPIECTTAGALRVGAGEVDSIVDFVVGLDSVTNPTALVPGTEEEGDAELLAKIEASRQNAGTAVDRAIRGKLLDFSFVSQALVISNRSDTVDANGFPKKSLNVILWPPTTDVDERAQIADLITRVTPGGIEAHGAIKFFPTDENGYTDPEPLGYSFATEEQLHLDIVITKGANYPSNGDALVQDAALGISYGVGQSVSLLRILCEVAKVPGVQAAQVRAKLGATPAIGDINDIAVPATSIVTQDRARIRIL